MQNRIEPPNLLSRVMTFVFAAMVVLLGVMGVTLYKMFPLNRPQVFFLTTTPKNNMTVTLTEMPTGDENFDDYKRAFILEYIKARNEIIPNTRVMQAKWGNGDTGYVNVWSTPEIYAAFTETDMWRIVMNNMANITGRCSVEFPSGAIKPRTDATNTYAVRFSHLCEDTDKQLTRQDYTIIIGLDLENNSETKWSERLSNPLGLRVSGYEIESGDGDPLDIPDQAQL